MSKEGVPFGQLPDDWACPVCNAPKDASKRYHKKNPFIESFRQKQLLKLLTDTDFVRRQQCSFLFSVFADQDAVDRRAVCVVPFWCKASYSLVLKETLQGRLPPLHF